LRVLRSVLIVTSALALLAVGAMSAAAGNRHSHSAGQVAGATKAGAITTLTTGATLEIKAADDEEKAQEAALEAAKAQAAAAAAQAQAQAEAQAQVAQPQASEQDVNDEQDTEDEGEGSD
jgi:peptidoglycan DL-endopeptidase CwlO